MVRSRYLQKTYDSVELVAAFASFAAATALQALIRIDEDAREWQRPVRFSKGEDSRASLFVFDFAFAKLLPAPVSVLESAVAMTQ
ncbi:hypothetical protein N7444_013105 [Penicillium canescens]|nr:hypothetical protein N7444_013105 [Penicillium canescens]